ncbi:MAG: hypothetical protein NVS2B14_00100 [Chamaesiphon sp.]
MTPQPREIRSRVPRELKKEFDKACIDFEMSKQAALEEAIRVWLNWKKKQPPADD